MGEGYRSCIPRDFLIQVRPHTRCSSLSLNSKDSALSPFNWVILILTSFKLYSHPPKLKGLLILKIDKKSEDSYIDFAYAKA
jgi:hypothetical protein